MSAKGHKQTSALSALEVFSQFHYFPFMVGHPIAGRELSDGKATAEA
jgi:hypothetical protein